MRQHLYWVEWKCSQCEVLLIIKKTVPRQPYLGSIFIGPPFFPCRIVWSRACAPAYSDKRTLAAHRVQRENKKREMAQLRGNKWGRRTADQQTLTYLHKIVKENLDIQGTPTWQKKSVWSSCEVKSLEGGDFVVGQRQVVGGWVRWRRQDQQVVGWAATLLPVPATLASSDKTNLLLGYLASCLTAGHSSRWILKAGIVSKIVPSCQILVRPLVDWLIWPNPNVKIIHLCFIYRCCCCATYKNKPCHKALKSTM